MLDIMQQLKFKREFYSGSDKCNLGCLYCFADIEGFRKLDVVNFKGKNSESDDVLIYYPSCDTEFNWSDNFDKFINKLVDSNTKSIISISTKGKLRKSIIEKIKKANDILIKQNIGFIKFSVSITNKSMISVIEPHASSYQERLDLLNYLNDQEIPSSVILKPILPFIETKEYIEIINDTIPFTANYLLGGLYVSKESVIYNDFIKDKYETTERKADWLSYKPMWTYIDSTNKMNILQEYINNNNKNSFFSDLELLESMWENLISNKLY
jgi:DNA repair photolyase